MMTFGMQISSLLDTRIIEDRNLVDTIEDWSRVRSPGRARRRRKRGFPQNIVHRQVPKETVYSTDGGRTLIMHPEIARKMERQIATRMDKLVTNTILGQS